MGPDHKGPHVPIKQKDFGVGQWVDFKLCLKRVCCCSVDCGLQGKFGGYCEDRIVRRLWLWMGRKGWNGEFSGGRMNCFSETLAGWATGVVPVF